MDDPEIAEDCAENSATAEVQLTTQLEVTVVIKVLTPVPEAPVSSVVAACAGSNT